MINETKVRVRYEETDRMGFVYYGNYFIWFEVGRNEFFRKLGFRYRKLEENGLYLPVIESHCEYKSPAKYDDLLIVITKLTSLTSAKLRFDYKIVKQNQKKPLALGYTIHAFMNEQGRATSLKKVNPFIWNHLKKVVI